MFVTTIAGALIYYNYTKTATLYTTPSASKPPVFDTPPNPGLDVAKEPATVPAIISEHPLESQDTAHPMLRLITDANAHFDRIQARQSKTMQEAVNEYRRRYGIAPPPNYDKWYEFARARDVQLIDEYDGILDSITPFWGLKPSVIRARARETQGYDNVMISMLIRHGNITKVDGGRDWMVDAVIGMTKGFAEWLPDMDVVINAYDEPRVILPHEDLAKLVKTAKDVSMKAAAAVAEPNNKFSPLHVDMTDGTWIEEVLRSKFNAMAKQETWTTSRMSCHPDSPARSNLNENNADNITSFATGPLPFIHNATAFSDICSSPSFADSFGFFSGANVFNVVHDLYPIFSQSKISSYQDIIFPSPWYWYNKVKYDATKDIEWRQKEDKVWWRGSTTGGYSRGGSWRRQHRQHIVQMLNADDHPSILVNTNKENPTSSPDWQVKSISRTDFRDVVDVAFTEIGQCDPADCKAQKSFFSVAKKVKPDDAWKFKFLLDMDGNAFSGRFYAFLKSKSLTFKMAIFREWHAEVLRPWVHYVPLTLGGGEWLESVRWLLGERDGKLAGERMARSSTEWAEKVLRREDMEVWWFRMLLEYGRVVDDRREEIGYVFPKM